MSWFARIEERCAAFIERAFAGMFPSDVEPAQIARKLIATMEARSRQTGGVISAPSSYAVSVNPIDFARLNDHREYLETEWRALIEDVAQRAGIQLDPDVSVHLREDARVAAGAIHVKVRRGSDAATDGPGPVRFVLRSASGEEAQAFAVDGATRVGRSPECDIVLADPSVSRMHALLDVRSDDLLVYDSGSTNGTFVNGERVETRALRDGDIVSFGKRSLRVNSEPAASA